MQMCCFLSIRWPLLLLLLTLHVSGGDESGQADRAAPKDYSYSPKASRVKDLAGFFESMQRRNQDPSSVTNKEQDLVISLSEAASKLHLLMDGFPMEIKCNRYVKLIDRPNIRTFATVNLLANEDKQFNEIEQNDVNLLSRLQSERTFDALGKSQTIIQSLESERNNMRSAFETEVQLDLLDCINYYIYRHQRATLGLIGYVREARPKLDHLNNSPSHSVLEKYNELIGSIKEIEAKEEPDDRDNLAWLRSFAKMHDLVLENNFELPKLAQDFVTDSKRLERLLSFDGVLSQVDDVVGSILKQETDQQSSELEKNDEYRSSLFKLADMVEDFGDLLQEDTRELVEEPRRKTLIEDKEERERLKKLDNDSGASDDKLMELLEEAVDELKEVTDKQSAPATRNEVPTASSSDAKGEAHGLTGKYITGFNSQEARSGRCSSVPINLNPATDDLASKSVCTREAFELSANLRLFDDKSIEFDWAKTMAESVGKFMVNCLMRASYYDGRDNNKSNT